ncbi:MAG: 2-amino-4-hydroxy-6-hydroxymethyldihydropteridine diphosphokinase [Alsobacter sp.]
MAEVYASLGSNIGDKAANIAEALRRLAQAGVEVVACSPLYRTPPWGPVEQDWFLNACAHLRTDLAPRDLMRLCLEVERAMGRERLVRWGPRLIDVDLLAYDDLAIEEPDLSLPHPRLFERAFVLVPLLDVAPDFSIDGRRADVALEGLDTAGILRVPPG